MNSFISTIVTTLSISLSPVVKSQDLPFESGSTGADGALSYLKPMPEGVSSHAAAFDEARQNLVVFSASGGMWIFGESGWQRQFPATLPSVSSSNAMVYEPGRQRILLYGFNNQNTWTWDGADWTQINSTNNPPQGSGTMVYDAERGEVVALAGSASNTSTWTWDGSDWAEKAGANSPNVGVSPNGMAYDPLRKEVVMYGGRTASSGAIESGYSDRTFIWNGSVWTEKILTTQPYRRTSHSMAFDPVAGEVILFGGAASNRQYAPRDTWAWDGVDWTRRTNFNPAGGIFGATMTWDGRMQKLIRVGGQNYPSRVVNESSSWNRDTLAWDIEASRERVFDMTSRPDGIWNFTSIDIDSLVTVNFKRNATNTPVVWLASEEVRILGDLDLDGKRGGGEANLVDLKTRGAGGPGGGDGGRGGEKFSSSGTFRGDPGTGPGGGAGAINSGQNGENATHAGTYGDPYLRYAYGGSGGGGGASNQNQDGNGGGGGGGSIIIASSRDLILNGEISVQGGFSNSQGASSGGSGSGGSVRLSADRVLGSGGIKAGGTGEGWIRLESYVRTLDNPRTGQTFPFPSVSLPLATQDFANLPALRVTTVAGVAVADPPLGDFSAPDVVFSQAGPTTIAVASNGLADGTEIDLRVIIDGQVLTAPSQALAGGTANFTLSVPAGLGTIQVFTKKL